MIAIWITFHTVLAWANRPAWIPLLICLLILVAKLVPRTPAMLIFIGLLDRCRAGGAEVVLMEIPRGFVFDPYASLEREIAFEKDVQLLPDTWLRQVVILGPAFPLGRWFPDQRLSDDGIHSNQRGSEAIARRVAAALRKMYGEDVLKVPQ